MKFDLFIDRSGAVQSAALAADGEVVAETRFDGLDSRSGEWVPALRDFISGREPGRIVAGAGPGSFAGTRAAIAFAEGWCAGRRDCRAFGIVSPAAAARQGRRVAVAGDSRKGMRWVALFDGFRPQGGIFQCAAVDLASRIPDGFEIVSPDVQRIGEELRALFGERFLGSFEATAGNLARAAAANPSLLTPEPLPVYLNPAVR